MSEVVDNEQYEIINKRFVQNEKIIQLFSTFFNDLGINANSGNRINDRINSDNLPDYISATIQLFYDGLFSYAIKGNYTSYKQNFGWFRDGLYTSIMNLIDNLGCELSEFRDKYNDSVIELLENIYSALNHNFRISTTEDFGIMIINENDDICRIDKDLLPGFIKDLLSINFTRTYEVKFKFKYREINVLAKITKDKSDNYKTKTLSINKDFVISVLDSVLSMYESDSSRKAKLDQYKEELNEYKKEIDSYEQRISLYEENEKILTDTLNDVFEKLKEYDPDYELPNVYKLDSGIQTVDTGFEAM
ncbi:hypothetical protein [uncultured Clostridium sp.]|uniref:hypothetical protein n=1 Tax=uncultured Clostridium sp. TaxID=59620 RepID=UPI00263A5B23|nr:hypothetical protein [uncultured Clostridium sp.]